MSCKSNSDLDFMRDVLIRAINERRDNILTDLFDLYEETRKRCASEPESIPEFLTEKNIEIKVNDNVTPFHYDIDKSESAEGTEYNFNLNSDYLSTGLNNDVISFT